LLCIPPHFHSRPIWTKDTLHYPSHLFITIAGIWALVIEIIGVRELQEVSTGRAIIAALLLPAIIVIIAIAATVYVYVSGMLSAS